MLSATPWCGFPALASEPLPKFERIVIDDDFPGGYQVEVADVNGDGKPDIVGVGGSTCAWYENPTWKKRIITTGPRTPGIISSATADLDGDGKAEVAIAYEFEMNDPKRGKLLMAEQGRTADEPWATSPLGDFPSIHRLRWGKFTGQVPPTGPDLMIASIFGPDAKPPKFDQDPAPLRFASPGRGPGRAGGRVIDELPIMHAISVVDLDGDGVNEVLAAYAGGVARTTLSPGARRDWSADQLPGEGVEDPWPKGASEVQLGRLADGRLALATIEPWHGAEVVVRVGHHGPPRKPSAKAGGMTRFGPSFGPRLVIDSTLDDGHALWVADVDGDGDDEVFAGHRGKDFRISAYDYDSKDWVKTVIDRGVAAQDLRGGDLDGDGAPDVVAIGGKTHNVVWYRPIREKAAKR